MLKIRIYEENKNEAMFDMENNVRKSRAKSKSDEK